MQPECLRRGNEFQERVQADWSGQIEGANARKERFVRRTFGPGSQRVWSGRVDIFIDLIDNFVTVVEIKATDWDRVKHRRKLLARHRRQVVKYVDKFLHDDRLNVCAGIIYPQSPRTEGLREQIEAYLNDWGLQVVWYDD